MSDSYRSEGVGWLQDWFAPRPVSPEPGDEPLTAESISLPEMSRDLAEASLIEARSIYEQRNARLARVEARATTLQATVGIAATLSVAAAALVLDGKRVPDPWSNYLAVVIALVVVALVMCGWFAVRATLARTERARQHSRRMLERFDDAGVPQDKPGIDMQVVTHIRRQIEDLLIAANRNRHLDMERTALLAAARRWYQVALGLLVVLVVLFAVYALSHSPAS
jgi:hypothetical protein